MKKIVITGGPSSGKSTLIQTLKDQGQLVVEESAAKLISSELKNGGNILPWIKFDEFEKALVDYQIKQESSLKTLDKNKVFLDRGLIDVFAYYQFAGITVPSGVSTKILNNGKYDQIFFLETLPEKYWKIHNHDFERSITYSKGKEISRLILHKYKEFGYKPEIIRVGSVNERTKKILSKELRFGK
jgi:predicted ATPase